MKRFSLLSFLILLLAFPAHAQSAAPYIVSSTKPMPTELRTMLNNWLAATPPSDAPYYVVTYWKVRGNETVVSLAGVNLATPETAWSLEDGAQWLGTVTVSAAGDVSPLSLTTQARSGGGVSFLPRLAGGGAYVAFPFASGSAAQYGPRGVHGSGDYGTSGMLAVDLVGGDGMGASSMPPYAYASDGGAIDYVCDDGTSVAIRTHNSSTGDYFLYAHLLDNSNLAIGHEFGQGELLGSLKYGTFDDTCGWAQQQATQYHIHWMFIPSGGKFQVGSCTLKVSTQVWDCGGETIKTGNYLTGGGGFANPGNTSGTSGAGSAVTDPTFWDYILVALVAIVDPFKKMLPSHTSFAYVYMISNVSDIVIRLGWVLVRSNINLGPMMAAIGFSFILSLARLALWVFTLPPRLLKWLVPLA